MGVRSCLSRSGRPDLGFNLGHPVLNLCPSKISIATSSSLLFSFRLKGMWLISIKSRKSAKISRSRYKCSNAVLGSKCPAARSLK